MLPIIPIIFPSVHQFPTRRPLEAQVLRPQSPLLSKEWLPSAVQPVSLTTTATPWKEGGSKLSSRQSWARHWLAISLKRVEKRMKKGWKRMKKDEKGWKRMKKDGRCWKGSYMPLPAKFFGQRHIRMDSQNLTNSYNPYNTDIKAARRRLPRFLDGPMSAAFRLKLAGSQRNGIIMNIHEYSWIIY